MSTDPSFTYKTLYEDFPPVLSLESDKSRCTIALYGAQVLSFIPKGGKDLLWVSQKAVYQTGKAIRGGIPICWPWFGAHPTDDAKPSHGFARISPWKVVATGTEGDDPFALLRLESSDATRRLFDYDFLLELKVVAGESLTLSLTTTNRDSRPFEITEALHSYFGIGDISRVRIEGLDGKRYIDQLLANRIDRQSGDVRFEAEVDRIYDNGDTYTIRSLLGSRTVTPTGSKSTVVWNPWIIKSARLNDFGDAEYKAMVCVETANAGSEMIRLAPGKSHTVGVTIKEL